MAILSKGTGKNGEPQSIWDAINISVFEVQRTYRETVCIFLGREYNKLTELQNWKKDLKVIESKLFIFPVRKQRPRKASDLLETTYSLKE